VHQGDCVIDQGDCVIDQDIPVCLQLWILQLLHLSLIIRGGRVSNAILTLGKIQSIFKTMVTVREPYFCTRMEITTVDFFTGKGMGNKFSEME